MGAFCSCFHILDGRANANAASDSSSSEGCLCPRCLIHKFMNKHGNLFKRRQQLHNAPAQTNQPGPSSNNEADCDHPVDSSHTTQCRGEAMPDTIDHRSSEEQLNETRSRRHEKGKGSQLQVEPVRHRDNLPRLTSNHIPPSSVRKPLSLWGTHMISNPYPLSDDEDVCPTCLEEYTLENPKIVAECSHHFHLGCIYAWMERSSLCPVCNKVMLFNETS